MCVISLLSFNLCTCLLCYYFIVFINVMSYQKFYHMKIFNRQWKSPNTLYGTFIDIYNIFPRSFSFSMETRLLLFDGSGCWVFLLEVEEWSSLLISFE